jgi:nicotinamidase/pyrazinamidase
MATSCETPNSALVVVDPQRDFEQDGSLCVSGDANSIYILINALLALFEVQVASQDYHGYDHSSFADLKKGEVPFVTVKDVVLPDNTVFKQKCWTVHCVRGTSGVRMSKSFSFDPTKLRIVRKGTLAGIESYSAVGDSTEEKKFERTNLIEHLRANNIVNVYVCRLAFDYCVGSTALDLAKAGFNVYVLTDCTRYVFQANPDDITNKVFSEDALTMYTKLVTHGVNFITSAEVPTNVTSIQMGEQILPLACDLEDI